MPVKEFREKMGPPGGRPQEGPGGGAEGTVFLDDPAPPAAAPPPAAPPVSLRRPDAMIAVADLSELQRRSWQIARRLESDGFCILQSPSTDAGLLTALAAEIGFVQGHLGANAQGVEEVSVGRLGPVNPGSAPRGPATEGAHLNGLVAKNGQIRRVGPPAVVAVQCVEQSAATSAILLDGAEILCDLVLDEPWHARRLLEPGAVSYCTDDQMAMDRSVFEPLGDGRYRIRFRYDEGLLMEDWARSSVEHLREGYVSNSRYATRVPLDVGHILLVDNQRMLMAFDEGPSDAQRLLRRLWIALDDQAILVPARGKGRPQPALRHYEAYQPLTEDRTRRNTGRLKLGIRVPPELATTIAGLSESVLH